MTLQTYDAEMLDRFALQLFDLASSVREMANLSREHAITDLPLHDKKAQEWCAKLQQWLHKSRAELDVRIRQLRAKRRAMSFGQ